MVSIPRGPSGWRLLDVNCQPGRGPCPSRAWVSGAFSDSSDSRPDPRLVAAPPLQEGLGSFKGAKGQGLRIGTLLEGTAEPTSLSCLGPHLWLPAYLCEKLGYPDLRAGRTVNEPVAHCPLLATPRSVCRGTGPFSARSAQGQVDPIGTRPMVEETEAQRGSVTCPTSHSK